MIPQAVVGAFRYNGTNCEEHPISDQLPTIEDASAASPDLGGGASSSAGDLPVERGASEAPSVARSTATMSVATTLSRVTGFVRMWVTAVALATGAVASSYNIANNIPNMIFELVAGGILSSVFIPTFLDVQENDGEEAAWRFASQVLTVAVFLLGAIAIVGTILPQPFIWTQTFRLSAESGEAVRRSAEFFFRFFAVQVVVYGAGMVMQAVLNAQRRFLWTALGPVFNNLVVIATMIVVATMPLSTTTLAILAGGTTLGVVAMFAVMVPSLLKIGFRYTFSFGLRDPRMRQMAALALPAIVYVVTNLVTVSFRNASALAVGEAGPSVLMYAWTWYQLPYGILAVALATAVFTEMSTHASRGDIARFKVSFSSGLRTTALLIMPSAAILFALATPLTALYTAGRFSAADVPAVAEALRGWAVGLTFFALMMFVLRAFYSLRDTKTPAMTNIATSAVQIGGYLVLTTGIAGWSGLGLVGIPTADALFYVLQFAALLYLLRRKVGSFNFSNFVWVFGRMAIVALLTGVAAWGATAALAAVGVATSGGIGAAALQVSVAATVGLLAAWLSATALRIPEIALVKSLVSRIVTRLLPARP